MQEDEEDPNAIKYEDLDDVNFLKCKNLFEAAFDTLVRVSSVWYNNLGNDQKSIQKSLDELFQDEVESDEDK